MFLVICFFACPEKCGFGRRNALIVNSSHLLYVCAVGRAENKSNRKQDSVDGDDEAETDEAL